MTIADGREAHVGESVEQRRPRRPEGASVLERGPFRQLAYISRRRRAVFDKGDASVRSPAERTRLAAAERDVRVDDGEPAADLA
jgi:hypothetical protein